MVGSSGEYFRNTSISFKHKYSVQQSPEELASSEKGGADYGFQVQPTWK
jgi:hypothetical protein